MRSLVEPQFIVRTIFTILTIALTVGMMYGTLTSRMDAMEREKRDAHAHIEQMHEAQISNLEKQLARLQQQLDRVLERLDNRR